MKRWTSNELFLDEKFLQYTKENFLYKGSPTYFDILDKAQAKYETAAPHLQKPYGRYLYKVLNDTLEIYWLALFKFTNDIISSPFPRPFLKKEHIKIIRKPPTKQFWMRSLLLLGAFLIMFQNLPTQLRIITNTEEFFRIKQYPISDTRFENFIRTNKNLKGRMLCPPCGNAYTALFKQWMTPRFDLIGFNPYSPRASKDRDKLTTSIHKVFIYTKLTRLQLYYMDKAYTSGFIVDIRL
ncbi:unnamed protein product [Rhizophagus irregularis]|nr:unnamed protein product [Rhizophagus irregularis]